MLLDSYPIEHYSDKEIQDAYLILHPAILDRYEITQAQFHEAFPRGSNFSQLKYPIEDEHGITYHDSEGYYMAQRFDDLETKQKIALASQTKGKSKSEAYKYKEFMNDDPNDRIKFMRNAIREKFNGSKWRNEMLLDTAGREIIEFTYWNDQFFGISHETRTGRNILGKLLMEYRDDLLAQIAEYK